jgi:hypothetical protein
MNILDTKALLGGVRSLLNGLMITEVATKPIPDEYRGLHIKNLNTLLGQCEALELVVSAQQIRNQLEALNHGKVENDGIYAARAGQIIAGTIETEIGVKLCFVLTPTQTKLFTDPLSFGDEVGKSFPSASPEIEEVGKCLACSRHSAAVFHLMRTLEVGLRCLAKKFEVDFEHKNWQNILDQVDKKIGEISAQTHGALWKAEQQFYSEASAHFRVLKNAWRNYAMHLHERYSEDRALDIYNAVRSFMRSLAGGLHE